MNETERRTLAEHQRLVEQSATDVEPAIWCDDVPTFRGIPNGYGRRDRRWFVVLGSVQAVHVFKTWGAMRDMVRLHRGESDE